MTVQTQSAPFALPALPYGENALEPAISARTMSFHHGKHHKAYVDKLNELIQGTRYAGMQLDEIVKATHDAKDDKDKLIFNNAGQHWNHSFFWPCLTPRTGQPTGELLDAINRAFGSYDGFKEKFANAAVSQFGSGWAWLVSDKGKLSIEKTPNAVTPMAMGRTCLLTIDVWEHAYYLDYQNRRPDFVKAVIDKLLNWDFAMQNFRRAG